MNLQWSNCCCRKRVRFEFKVNRIFFLLLFLVHHLLDLLFPDRFFVRFFKIKGLWNCESFGIFFVFIPMLEILLHPKVLYRCISHAILNNYYSPSLKSSGRSSRCSLFLILSTIARSCSARFERACLAAALCCCLSGFSLSSALSSSSPYSINIQRESLNRNVPSASLIASPPKRGFCANVSCSLFSMPLSPLSPSAASFRKYFCTSSHLRYSFSLANISSNKSLNVVSIFFFY